MNRLFCLFSLSAGVCLAQKGSYDYNCWVKFGGTGTFECIPCYAGQVSGSTCTTWDAPCVATQEACCAQPGTTAAVCMDNWDECRGATSFDPSHAITNAQCLDWCRAKDPQFATNCGVESYDYKPGAAENRVPVPWSTNQCYTQYFYSGSGCIGNVIEHSVTVPGAPACQDACAAAGDCCWWYYTGQCIIYKGGLEQDCTDVILPPPASSICEIQAVQGCIDGTQDCLICGGTKRCRPLMVSIYGPAVCYHGVDACTPGNSDTCHYGGTNPVNNGTLPPPTVAPSTVAPSTIAATTVAATTDDDTPVVDC